uniref:Putative ovule protein n=1 Tax=Solanum chacoense TaxID=4108 RepID=A0A0V0GIA4_SOLCH
MPSKHLEFLSFQIAHHIEAGIILHLVLSFARAPASSQLYNASVTLLGIVQDMPLRLKKIFQSCRVYLQCRNRWFTVSKVSPHRKHLEHKVIPLFITLS